MKNSFIFIVLVLSLGFSNLLAKNYTTKGWSTCWHGKYQRNGKDEGPNKGGYYNTGTNSPKDYDRYVRSGYDTVVCRDDFATKGAAQKWASACSRFYSKYYRGKMDYGVNGSICYSGFLDYHSGK